MLNQKDFSIVLPAYNDVGIFRHALESVRRQRNVEIEIIIVDDSNRNNDIENYVSSLNDSRICYTHNNPSLGAVKNWNSGLALCHAENIMVVHHDEAMPDEFFLVKVKKQLEQNDVVVSNVEVHLGDGKSYGLYNTRIKKMAINHPSILFAVNVFGPCAVVAFKHYVMEQFDTATNWFVDVEWYYRLIKKHKTTYLPSVTIISQHGHKDQITNSIDIATEARKDAKWLNRKYSSTISVRLAIWLQINVLHNGFLHGILKKVFGR